MLNIVCAYAPGKGFSDEYVYRLQSAVAEHYKQPHRFVCLTNEKLDVETVKPRGNNKGWWIKLHLFSAFKQAVYFDLDTMIVNDITDIVEYPHRFTGLTGFKTGRFASGFMAWDGDFSYLDQDIDTQTARRFSKVWTAYGDQGFINRYLKVVPELTDALFPTRFVSYKWGVRRPGRVPDKASVVCFHGKPRPHEVNWELPSGN